MARCGARCALKAPFLCNTRFFKGLGAWCHCTTSSLRSRVSTCPARRIKTESEAHRLYRQGAGQGLWEHRALQSLHRQA